MSIAGWPCLLHAHPSATGHKHSISLAQDMLLGRGCVCSCVIVAIVLHLVQIDSSGTAALWLLTAPAGSQSPWPPSPNKLPGVAGHGSAAAFTDSLAA